MGMTIIVLTPVLGLANSIHFMTYPILEHKVGAQLTTNPCENAIKWKFTKKNRFTVNDGHSGMFLLACKYMCISPSLQLRLVRAAA